MKHSISDIKIKKKDLNINTANKFNSPKSIFHFNNKTSSNYLFYKINSMINNIERRNLDSKEENSKINNNKDFNALTTRKHNLVNTIQLDRNYLNLISKNNIKNKKIFSYIDSNKNNSQFIRNKKSKIDLIKYKFLLGKMNYYKRITNLKYDFLHYKRKINPFHSSLKRMRSFLSLNDDTKFNSLNNENLSFPSIENHKINSSTQIKFKNFNFKKDKNQTKNNKIEKYSIYKNIFNKNKNSDINNAMNNKFHHNIKLNDDKKGDNLNSEKIIEDNYNEYLNDISSSDSNSQIKSKIREKTDKKIEVNSLNEQISNRLKKIRKQIINLEKSKASFFKGMNLNMNNYSIVNKINKLDSRLKLRKIHIKSKN